MMTSNDITHVCHNVNSPHHVMFRRKASGSVVWEYYVSETKGWYYENVNFGVTKKPKQMLKQNRITTIGEIKK